MIHANAYKYMHICIPANVSHRGAKGCKLFTKFA